MSKLKRDDDNFPARTGELGYKERMSFSNKHVEDLDASKRLKSRVMRASATAIADRLFESSFAVLDGSESVKKRCLESKKIEELAPSKRNIASNLSHSFVCNICGRNFSCNAHLNRHIFLHTGLKPFNCVKCGKSFARKDSMKAHMFSLHTPYNTGQYNRRKRSNGQNSASKVFEFSSPDADDGMTAMECYPNSTTLFGTDKMKELVSLKRKKTSNVSLVVICNFCGRDFKQKGELKKHILLHENLNPFKCSICGKPFASTDNLMRHKRLAHIPRRLTPDSYYCCAYCNRRYQSKENLAYHIKREHISDLNLEEFGCSVCGKTFNRSGARKRHERTAHVEKNCYCCTNCGNRYKYSYGLSRHLKHNQCVLK